MKWLIVLAIVPGSAWAADRDGPKQILHPQPMVIERHADTRPGAGQSQRQEQELVRQLLEGRFATPKKENSQTPPVSE